MSLRVLVVDDNPEVVDTTMSAIRAEGYEAYPCHKADDVLGRVKEHSPDVVVLDIALPGKSGWDVAREIRSATAGKRPMLIGISGQYMKGADRVLAEMTGFDYYLTKPFDNKVLLALFQKAAR